MNRSVLIAAFMIAVSVTNAAAQEGVPGGRIGSGREHRALVRAEAYSSATAFLAKWRELWRAGDVDALIKLYTDDASLRLPGQRVVRTKTPLKNALRSALSNGAPIEMSNIEFDSDGEIAVLVSCYLTRSGGTEISGVVTAVLYRSGRSWKLRMHMFDTPHPVNSTPEQIGC